jgi:type I restriction enzyme M protein
MGLPHNLTKPLESSTRKKIDQWLINLGWNTDEESPECNVVTERGFTEEQETKLGGNNPDFLLLKSGTTQPLAIVEAKRIGESLENALKDAIKKYAKPLNVSIVFATDGMFIESWHTKEGKELTINDESLKELVTEKILLQFIEHGANIAVLSEEVRHSREELIKVFEWANNLMRKEGLRGLDRFVEFANILFLKIISEIEEDKEKTGEERILEEKYCWNSFSKLSPEMMMDYLNKIVLPQLVANYNHIGSEVFQSTLQIRNYNTLKEMVDRLSELTLINTESEIKGDAFEYFLKSLATGNDLGEYFTPRHIVKVMTKLVNPQYGEKIYDPCCGTGGFLIEAFRHIKKFCKITPEIIDKLKNQTVYGIELTNTARIAKMNMILAGDGHTNIHQKDALANPVNEAYDVVLTNFPFSQQTDYSHFYGLNTEDANPVFVKHIINSLIPTGRAAIVVFQGILYDSGKIYKDLREWLLKNCDVEAIIKLHNFVFRPYTGVNTSIIVFSKGKPTERVWFFNIENDGFEKTSSLKGRRRIAENDIDLLELLWSNKEITEKSWFATFDEIKKMGYNLNAETYKPLRKIDSSFPFVNLNDERYFETARGNEVGSDTYCGKDEGVPFIRVGDITGKGYTNVNTKATDYVGVSEEDILLSFDGTIGIVKRGFRGAISAGIRKIRSRDEKEILNDFLYFVLQSEDVQRTMAKYTRESTIAHAGESFGYIRIPKPPISLQTEMVERLKEKEEKILRIDGLLQSFKGRVIDENLFEMEQEKIRTLEELISVEPQNGIYKHKSFYGSGTPIVRIDNIYDGQLFLEVIHRVSLTNEELEAYSLNVGDIVLNRVNSEEYIGKCGVYKGIFSDCVFESNMMRFSVNTDIVFPDYVVYYLTSAYGKRQILTKIKRAINQVSINQSDVKSLTIPIPSKPKQMEIINMIDEQIRTTQNLEVIRNRLREEMNQIINKLYLK